MNSNVIAKLLQAKKLEYEALKELMPEKVLKQLQGIETALFEFIEEVVVSGMNTTAEKTASAEKTGTKTRKVVVEP